MKNIFKHLTILVLVVFLGQCSLEKIQDSLVASAPNAAFTLDKTSGDAPCTINITNTSAGGQSFAWNFGDNTSSTDENPAPHTYNTPGTPTIRLIVTGEQNLKDTFSVQVSIVAAGVKPIAQFTITNNGCTAPCSTSFTNTSTNGATYRWDFGDPNSGSQNNSTEISTAHNYTQPGSYQVKLVATNGVQKDSITQNVTISGIKFEKLYTQYGPAVKVKQLSDGGFIIAGTLNNNVYLVRTDAVGTIINERTYTYSNADLANDVIQLSDGSFVVVGTSYNAAISNSDGYYLKTSANLNAITGPVRIGESDGDEEFKSILELTDGSVMMTGYSTVSATANTDVYVARYSSNLNTLYFKRRIAAPEIEVGLDAIQVSDGFMITGYINYTAATPSNALLLKIDDSGMPMSGFPKAIGGAGDETAFSILKINATEFMIGGFISGTGAGGLDVYLQKINAQGNTTGLPFTIGTADNEVAYDVIATSDGEFAIAGQSGLDAYFAKLDANGSAALSKPYTLNGEEAFYSIQQTSDGGFVMGGYKGSALYFVKTDKDGKFN